MGFDKCLVDRCFDLAENPNFTLLEDEGIDCMLDQCLSELRTLDGCEHDKDCVKDNCLECQESLAKLGSCHEANMCEFSEDKLFCVSENCMPQVGKLKRCLKKDKLECFGVYEADFCRECIPLENAAKKCVLTEGNTMEDCEHFTEPYDNCVEHCLSEDRVMFGHGGSKWFKACANGDVEVVKGMLKNGQDVDEVQTATEMTCSMYGVKNGHMYVVNAVAESDAECLLSNHDGDTVLHLAARSNKRHQHRLVKTVLNCDHAGLVNSQNNMGQTALTVAARQVDGALAVSALLDAGADVNMAENDGDTAALVAYRNNAYLSLEVMLKHGVDLSYQGKKWKNTQRRVPHLLYLVAQKMKNSHKDLSKWLKIIAGCAIDQGQDIFNLLAPNGKNVIDLACSDPMLREHILPHLLEAASSFERIRAETLAFCETMRPSRRS